MDERTLDRLLRQVVELDRLEPGQSTHAVASESASTRGVGRVMRVRPARPERRWVGWIAAGLATAAIVFIALARWPVAAPGTAPYEAAPAAVPVELVSDEHGKDATNADQRHFSACAERDGYALVLLREWRAECQCLSWTLQQLESGSQLMRLLAGQSNGIVVDVAGDPPVEQALVVAVASRARDLPRDAAAREQLLTCLNDSAPPELPGGGSSAEWARAVEGCLPDGVTVVQRAFVSK